LRPSRPAPQTAKRDHANEDKTLYSNATARMCNRRWRGTRVVPEPGDLEQGKHKVDRHVNTKYEHGAR
jgi:hypothetical protein